MARTRWPPGREPWPLAQARQHRNGTAGGCQKEPGPGRQLDSKDSPNGVSRFGGQAGTQATDPTPKPIQNRGSRAGALSTSSLPNICPKRLHHIGAEQRAEHLLVRAMRLEVELGKTAWPAA